MGQNILGYWWILRLCLNVCLTDEGQSKFDIKMYCWLLTVITIMMGTHLKEKYHKILQNLH